MKFLKLSLKLLVFCFILLNAFIIVSGKSYFYKAIKIGYLKGHNTATIEDYQYFENRIVENDELHPCLMKLLFDYIDYLNRCLPYYLFCLIEFFK